MRLTSTILAVQIIVINLSTILLRVVTILTIVESAEAINKRALGLKVFINDR